MDDSPRYATIRDYLRVIREQRLIIVLCVVAFAGAALMFSSRQDEKYESSASMAFREEAADASDLGAAQPAIQTPEQRAATYAQRVTEPSVAERAQKRLGTTIASGELIDSLETQVEARTNFVVITARASKPETAAAVANAFAFGARDVFTDEVRDRFTRRARVLRQQNRRLRRSRSNPTTDQTIATTIALNTDRINRLESLADFAAPAQVTVRAEPNADPVEPKPVRNTVVGLVLGLTIGLVIAFLRDALDRRFRRIDEIRDALGLPLLGHVRDDVLGRSVVGGDRARGKLGDDELEAFRILRTNLDFLDVDTPVKRVVITSPLPEEGKSTVSSALAYAYAAAGKKVLLVECDLRRPTVAGRMELKQSPGLTDFLGGHAQPQDVLQTVSVAPPSVNGSGPEPSNVVVVITAGSPVSQPAELLGSQKFAQFLDEVSGAYDIVLLDTSPLLSVVDTLELIPRADGIVLCVRASKTTREQARAARQAIAHLPDRPIGVVVTGVKAGDADEYGYYSYGYAYGNRPS